MWKVNVKPNAVADYKLNKDAVDMSDILLINFLTARNWLKKFYTKVFWSYVGHDSSE